MIRSILHLRALGDDADGLERFYADHGVLQRAREFAGCRDAVLLRTLSGVSATHLVIADWDSAADYERWVQDPWRAALSRQLADLLDTTDGEPIVGGLFEFVDPR